MNPHAHLVANLQARLAAIAELGQGPAVKPNRHQRRGYAAISRLDESRGIRNLIRRRCVKAN